MNHIHPLSRRSLCLFALSAVVGSVLLLPPDARAHEVEPSCEETTAWIREKMLSFGYLDAVSSVTSWRQYTEVTFEGVVCVVSETYYDSSKKPIWTSRWHIPLNLLNKPSMPSKEDAVMHFADIFVATLEKKIKKEVTYEHDRSDAGRKNSSDMEAMFYAYCPSHEIAIRLAKAFSRAIQLAIEKDPPKKEAF